MGPVGTAYLGWKILDLSVHLKLIILLPETLPSGSLPASLTALSRVPCFNPSCPHSPLLLMYLLWALPIPDSLCAT